MTSLARHKSYHCLGISIGFANHSAVKNIAFILLIAKLLRLCSQTSPWYE